MNKSIFPVVWKNNLVFPWLILMVALSSLFSCAQTKEQPSILNEKLSLRFAEISNENLYELFWDFLGRKEWKLSLQLCEYEKKAVITTYILNEPARSVLEKISRLSSFDLQVDESAAAIQVNSKNYPSCHSTTQNTRVQAPVAQLVIINLKSNAMQLEDQSFKLSKISLKEERTIDRLVFRNGDSICSVMKTLAQLQNEYDILISDEFCLQYWLKEDYDFKETNWSAVINSLLDKPIKQREKIGGLANKREVLLSDASDLSKFSKIGVGATPIHTFIDFQKRALMTDCEAIDVLKAGLVNSQSKFSFENCYQNRKFAVGGDQVRLTDYFNFILFGVRSNVSIDTETKKITVN